MRSHHLSLPLASLLISSLSPVHYVSAQITDPARYVNPFIGTINGGHTFPGKPSFSHP